MNATNETMLWLNGKASPGFVRKAIQEGCGPDLQLLFNESILLDRYLATKVVVI